MQITTLRPVYLTQGKVEEAKPFLNRSLFFAKKINDTKGQANAYNNLAIIAQSNLSYDSALVYLNNALDVYLKVNDSTGIARTYLNQAFIFDQQQFNDSAIRL